MKYIRIPKTAGELRDQISTAMLYVPERRFQFPDHQDFDGIFYSMSQSVDNLRKHFGDGKADQLLEMLAQAKAHYVAGDNKLGGALMEDTNMVVMKRQPWAYPKDLYRWPVDSTLPEVSEADILNKEDIE